MIRILLYPTVLLSSLVVAHMLSSTPLGYEGAVIGCGLYCLCLIALMERLFPWADAWNQSDGELPTDVAFVGIVALTDEFTRSFVAWLFTTHLSSQGFTEEPVGFFPLSVRVTAALVIGELGGWFSHWLLHVRRLPFWRIHRVHHAVGRLSVLNTLRFHPLDIALQLLCIHPLLHVTGLADPATLFWYGVFFLVVGQLSHSNIDTHCGILNYIFNTPEVHRLHHSRRIPVSNTNYGQILMVWDVLTGTFNNSRDPPLQIGDRFLSKSGVAQNLLIPIREIFGVI